MDRERREHGFERAGACGPRGLGLSTQREAELRLAVAWNAAAGPELARRATAVGGRGGVLEVEVKDPQWRDALEDLLPVLAARGAARAPDLGLRRWRLLLRDGDHVERSAAQDIGEEHEPLPNRRHGRRGRNPPPRS